MKSHLLHNEEFDFRTENGAQLAHSQWGSRQQKIAPAILSAPALIVEWGSKTTPVETRSGARPPTLGHEKRTPLIGCDSCRLRMCASFMRRAVA